MTLKHVHWWEKESYIYKKKVKLMREKKHQSVLFIWAILKDETFGAFCEA